MFPSSSMLKYRAVFVATKLNKAILALIPPMCARLVAILHLLRTGVELPAAEMKKIEVSKKVLELAKDPNRHQPKPDSYQLPDAYED